MRKGAIAIQFGANELSFVDLTMAKYAILTHFKQCSQKLLILGERTHIDSSRKLLCLP